MKKIVALIILVICILSLAACTAPEDPVLASLGTYENHEFYTSGGAQDYTDYAKYDFASAKIVGNTYFKNIHETDLTGINAHLDDFEAWVNVIQEGNASNELVVHYDFDRSIIDAEDFFYIDSEERTWSDGHTSFVRYSIYLFDTQTQVLYYFHNNL